MAFKWMLGGSVAICIVTNLSQTAICLAEKLHQVWQTQAQKRALAQTLMLHATWTATSHTLVLVASKPFSLLEMPQG